MIEYAPPVTYRVPIENGTIVLTVWDEVEETYPLAEEDEIDETIKDNEGAT